jgi:hypothetical protein
MAWKKSALGRMSEASIRKMLQSDEKRTAGDAAAQTASPQRKPRNDEEHRHQAAFFEILRLNERKFPELRFVFAVPNGGRRDKATAGKLWAEGVRAGVPDICIPIGRRGHFGAFIENKTATGKTSPAQADFALYLTRGNYAFKTCRSVDEQIAFIEWYLGIELVKR